MTQETAILTYSAFAIAKAIISIFLTSLNETKILRYRQEEWPVSENVLKAKSPNLPKWTVNKIFIVLFTILL